MFPAHLHRASRRSPPVEGGTLHKRFHITPRRCHLIHQAKYPLGVLPRVCWEEGYKKVVKRMVCNPMTVRIPPPNRKRLRNFFLSSPASNGLDPCTKELAANAHRERKRRTVEEEEQIFLDGQKTKRRRNDSSSSAHSAGDSPVTTRAPASPTPKPQAQKGSLPSESPDGLMSNSQTSTHIAGILSFGDRNAISSSYSSTLGVSISQLCKRNSPTSSWPQILERPAKRAREEELCPPSSSSASGKVSEDKVTDKVSQGEKVPDIDKLKQPNSGTLLSSTGSSGTRKRKTQLLCPRRGVPLTWPPAPQLGYTVTAEDLDQEKRESLQRLNEALEDKGKDEAISSSVTEKPPTPQPSFTFTTPDTGPAFSTASLPDPDTNHLLESWKNMQNRRDTHVFPKPAGAATTSAPVPLKTPSVSQVPISTSLPGLQQNGSSDAFLGQAPTFSRTQVIDTKTPAAPQAETLATGLPAPLPTTDPGMLFVVPCHLPSNPSCSAAPDMSSAYSTFQILFLSPHKSDSGSALVPSPSSTMAVATSSTLSTMTSTTITRDSKPVFGSIEPPSSVPLSTPFSFKQPTSTATSAPVYTGLATTTSTVAFVTTTSSSTESASKPTFGFGVNGIGSTSVSTSNSIPFASVPASATGLPKNENTKFNFHQPLPVSTSAAVPSFGQPLRSVTPMASSSSSTSTTITITGCSGFPTSFPTTLATTTSHQYLTTSNITTPTFNFPFASRAKSTPQPYPVPNALPTFGATQGHQQQGTGPDFAPSFGSSFTFGNTLASSAAPASAQTQLAVSGSEQIAFAGQKGTASALYTSASMQPTFRGTSSVSSLREAASGFPASTQTTNTRTTSSSGGRSTPSPFTFGDSAAPAGSWNIGLGIATSGNSNTSGAFSFRAKQSRLTPSESGQLQPHLRNILKPNQGFLGIQPAGSAAPAFASGAGSKNSGARQILQARRQHSRKK